MKLTAKQIQDRIGEVLPEGRVVPRHNDKGHFYEILDGVLVDGAPPIYPSVTGKIAIIKDEGIINFKMNQAIQYVFRTYKYFNNENIMEHLDKAARASMDIFEEAGDIGTEVHDTRHLYFKDWIKTGERPISFEPYLRPEVVDMRIKSSLRALNKFLDDYWYEPIACELFVYSHKLKTCGTLDDLGFIYEFENKENHEVSHEMIQQENGFACLNCDFKAKKHLALIDLKTSNQFKDHYFFQVALYWDMFKNLTKIRPEKCLIIKLSKEDGTYKVEDLKRPSDLASFAKSMVRTKTGLEYIRKLRKDNQKVVAPKIEL